MVNARREIAIPCSDASPSLPGSRFLLCAVGVMLGLVALPCNGLEIGQITVHSAQGEPLDAVAPVYLDAAESLESNCLSAGTQSDFPQSEHILLTDGVRMRLQPDRKAIRITTIGPVDWPAISIAVRARCRQGPVTVRAFNLRLMPRASRTASDAGSAPAATRTARAIAPLAGTIISVKPGDSIYGLCDAIYPHNEQAAHELALAIVIANPGLFPDGRPRPLEVGEELTIPDLRSVRSIVEQANARSTTAVRNGAAEPGITAPVPRQAHEGRLRLTLAHSLDLSPSRNVAGTKKPSSLRLRPAASLDAFWARLSRITEAQAQIDARITRLETIASTLQELFASRTGARVPSAAAPGATPARPALPQPQTPRAAGTSGTRNKLWHWAGIATGLAGLALAGFFVVRHWRQRRALALRNAKIGEMLETARKEATPLLGPDEARPPTGAPAMRESRSGGTQSGYRTAIERARDLRAQQTLTQPSHHAPPVKVGEPPAVPSPAAGYGDSFADSGEIPVRLRQEMNDSIDGTRSMFSDIDRFIALGRIQNAISLLEFQIERQPDDRPSWIKLMAVYRHSGMDDDFDRTYANFREKFGNN